MPASSRPRKLATTSARARRGASGPRGRRKETDGSVMAPSRPRTCAVATPDPRRATSRFARGSRLAGLGPMPVDLAIDIDNTPGALADVAAAISDAGVNISAATCVGAGDRAELHILVPHAEAAKHSLAISHLAISREREVVVVDVEDRPGVLADLTRRIAKAGVDLDLVYIATRNRVVFGAQDLDALRSALGQA